MAADHHGYLSFVAQHMNTQSRRSSSCINQIRRPIRSSSSVAMGKDENFSSNKEQQQKKAKKKDKPQNRLQNDAMNVYKEQEKLKQEKQKLRQNLLCARSRTFSECVKILNAVLTHCEAKACGKKCPTIPDICAARPTSGAKGNARPVDSTCGGYSPSGANRQNQRRYMERCEMPECGELAEDLSRVVKQEGGSPGPASGATTPKSKPPAAASGEAEEAEEDPACNFRPSVRILGEMAFQLERRILDYVFGAEGSKRRRFYGYTVSNICYMMEKESTSHGGGNDVIGRTEMTCRLRKMLCALEKYGYSIQVHADFAQEMVNKYGLLPTAPDESTIEMAGLNDAGALSCLISRLCTRQSEVHNLNILLNCLAFLSKCDGRPLLSW